MLGKESKIASNQGSPIRNLLARPLLKLFVITWAVLISKVYYKDTMPGNALKDKDVHKMPGRTKQPTWSTFKTPTQTSIARIMNHPPLEEKNKTL